MGSIIITNQTDVLPRLLVCLVHLGMKGRALDSPWTPREMGAIGGVPLFVRHPKGKKLSRIFSQSASRVISPASLRSFEIDAPVTPCIACTRARNRLTFRATPQKTTMSTPKTKRKPSSRTNDHSDNFMAKTIHLDHR